MTTDRSIFALVTKAQYFVEWNVNALGGEKLWLQGLNVLCFPLLGVQDDQAWVSPVRARLATFVAWHCRHCLSYWQIMGWRRWSKLIFFFFIFFIFIIQVTWTGTSKADLDSLWCQVFFTELPDSGGKDWWPSFPCNCQGCHCSFAPCQVSKPEPVTQASSSSNTTTTTTCSSHLCTNYAAHVELHYSTYY